MSLLLNVVKISRLNVSVHLTERYPRRAERPKSSSGRQVNAEITFHEHFGLLIPHAGARAR